MNHILLTRCFCDISNSAIWALSVSNKTGANKIIELVKNIHEALHENVYNAFVLFIEKSVAVSQAVRTVSGNISVSPQSRSVNVSSGSYCIDRIIDNMNFLRFFCCYCCFFEI